MRDVSFDDDLITSEIGYVVNSFSHLIPSPFKLFI